MAKCPNCGNDANAIGNDKYVCTSCGAQFTFEVPTEENSEIAQLKARIAALEAEKQAPVVQPKQKNAVKEKASNSPALVWLKKNWAIPVIILLVLITIITLMTCLIGLRGVYYNIQNPNEFYSFTATSYEHHTLYHGEDDVEKGNWHISDGRLYLEYEDTSLGIAIKVKEDLIIKESNEYSTIFLGDSSEYMSEFKRASIVNYSVLAKKATITFDANGGLVENSTEYKSTVKVGNKPIVPSNPTKLDYEFKGWYSEPYGYKDANSQPYYNQRVWENATYYANWHNPTKYTITLLGDGEKEITANEGDLLLPVLQKLYPECVFRMDGEIIDSTTRMPAYSVQIDIDNNIPKYEINITGDISITLFARAGENILQILTSSYQNYEFYLDNELIDYNFIMPNHSIDVVSVENSNKNTLKLIGDLEYSYTLTQNTNILMFLEQNFNNYDFYYDCIQIGYDFVMPDEDITLICIDQRIGFDNSYSVSIVGEINVVDAIGIGDLDASKPRDYFSLEENDLIFEILDDYFYACKFTYNGQEIDKTTLMPAKNILIKCELLEKLDWDSLEQIFTFEKMIPFSISCKNTDIGGNIVIPTHYYGYKIQGIYDFKNCANITSITLPETITYIDNNAFESCIGLTEITIPNSVKTIYRYTFKNCANLKKVYLPASLTYIDYTAFEGCYNLTDIYFDGTEEEWKAIQYHRLENCTIHFAN
ncbi:MAG: leucine-rich repeat protein [Clostridiales bacterium]|nr:leucine-rich repeat protein [Clostridiales bacterium]